MKPKKSENGMWAVDIDGATYEWERWGAEFALDTLTEILDLVGKPLGEMVAMAQAPDKATFQGKIISSMMRKLKKNKADVILVLKRLASGDRVFCNGRPINFDLHYENNLALLLKVANKAIEVHYGNFLDAVLDAMGHDPKEARAALSGLGAKSKQTSGSVSSPAMAH